MPAPNTIETVLRALVVLVSLSGCVGTSPARPSYLDRRHASVVHLSSDCSGVLVAPQRVLTAAHCVPDGEVRTVTFARRGGRSVRRVDGCSAHPQALETGGDCGDILPWRTVREHDLAMLHLAAPVPPELARPMPVLLEDHRAERWWRRQRVLLVGWHRHPAIVGPTRRHAGVNRVMALDGPLLRTMPIDRSGFSTEVGASGGPALLVRGRDEIVVGVLFGGRRADSPDSIYATTFHPENAAWIARTLGE
jgi:hypothetical protein